MALSFAVLDGLRTPTTVEALAQRLAVPVPHVRRELDRLERRGYVRRLDGETDPALACPTTACGACAFRSACGIAPDVRWQRADGAAVRPLAP